MCATACTYRAHTLAVYCCYDTPTRVHNRYTGARKVHADGNCLFRVIVFGALESHISACHVPALHSISRAFSGLGESHLLDAASKATAVNYVNRLVTAVERAAGIADSSERSAAAAAVLNDFELEIMTESSGVDLALIRACRVLAAQVTRRRAIEDTEEARMCRAALAADESTWDLTVDQYCTRDIECMGVYAQSFWVELGWLQEALGICTVLTTTSKPSITHIEAQVQPFKAAAEATAVEAAVAAAVAGRKKASAAQKQHAVKCKADAESAEDQFEKAQREASQHTLNMRYCPERSADSSNGSAATATLVHMVLNKEHYHLVYPNAEQWQLLEQGKVTLHTGNAESCAQISKNEKQRN
eukprot:12374-Heterococcus_DN1.PRE.3